MYHIQVLVSMVFFIFFNKTRTSTKNERTSVIQHQCLKSQIERAIIFCPIITDSIAFLSVNPVIRSTAVRFP